jgi:hypothetical protein
VTAPDPVQAVQATRVAHLPPAGPSALRRAHGALLEHVAAEALAGLWWFPPLRRGRVESGLLAAALDPAADPTASADKAPAASPSPQHILVTLAWSQRETGQGPVFEAHFREEGEAPADRLPRILGGVARRMDEGLGDPRYLEAAGDPARVDAWLEELES